MTQHNTSNVQLSNYQFNNLKYGLKIFTEVTLKISLNVAGESNGENNFLHNLFLTNRQFSKPFKAILCIK